MSTSASPPQKSSKRRSQHYLDEKKEKLKKILIEKLGLDDLRLLRLRGHTEMDKTYKHSSAETNDKEMSK
jgi:hypothetical protein